MAEKEVEVREVSEREIWIGEHRMYLGDDNILYVTVVGDIDGEVANGMKEVDITLKDRVKEKFDVLADIDKSGKHSPEARKIWKEMAEDDRTRKVAMFGMHPVARVIASFVMGVSRKKDMRFFGKKEEALAWLKK